LVVCTSCSNACNMCSCSKQTAAPVGVHERRRTSSSSYAWRYLMSYNRGRLTYMLMCSHAVMVFCFSPSVLMHKESFPQC
jgi:hypothetical protein